MQAPFIYFGGKRTVAAHVWRRFGDVTNYVEPFVGSAAVLLARPEPFSGTETVNDADAYLENFWRALQAEPDEVAHWIDWPVNEARLESVHKWLVTAARKREHARRMKDEMHYYSAKIAGLWCYGLCAWIGHGWCAGEWHGPDSDQNNGCGINVRDPERGGKRPHLFRGRGVHKQRPHLGSAGQGECARRTQVLIDWMRLLADRLRNVRVCCGDWTRVLGPTPTFKNGTTAVFLDPPCSAEAGRDNAIYSEESGTVAHVVRTWCLANGGNRELRIALCGYEGEHEELETHGWRVWHWKAHGGYGVVRGGGEYTNKYRERIWFSPSCVGVERGLFDDQETLEVAV